MEPSEHRWASAEDAASHPDVAAALVQEIHQPLRYLLGSLERAHQALRARLGGGGEQAALRAARCLADAQATAQHLLRLVDDVGDHARVERRAARRLDLRVAVRAAAAMVQPGGAVDAAIAVDAPEAAWIEGVDTRLVDVFVTLFAEALADEMAVIARVRESGGEVVVELRHGAPLPSRTQLHACAGSDEPSRALARSVVRHIIAAHGGRVERWPALGGGIAVRVTMPAAPPNAARE